MNRGSQALRDYVHRDDVLALLAWLVDRQQQLGLELAPMLRECVTAPQSDADEVLARCQATTALKYAALSAELYARLRTLLFAH